MRKKPTGCCTTTEGTLRWPGHPQGIVGTKPWHASVQQPPVNQHQTHKLTRTAPYYWSVVKTVNVACLCADVCLTNCSLQSHNRENKQQRRGKPVSSPFTPAPQGDQSIRPINSKPINRCRVWQISLPRLLRAKPATMTAFFIKRKLRWQNRCLFPIWQSRYVAIATT